MEPVIGLDFGTTNSAIAVAADDRQASLASFADAGATTTSNGCRIGGLSTDLV